MAMLLQFPSWKCQLLVHSNRLYVIMIRFGLNSVCRRGIISKIVKQKNRFINHRRFIISLPVSLA